MLKRKILLVFTFIIIISHGELFSLMFIPREARLLSGFFMNIIFVILIIANYLYFNKGNENIKKHFSILILLMLLSVLGSLLVAKYHHHQPYYLTLWRSKNQFFFLFYFYLHSFHFTRKEVEDLILAVGFSSLVVFFAQYAVYPTMILDARVAEDRGTVRIFFKLLYFVTPCYFYYLNGFFKEKKTLHLLLALLFLSTFVIQGSRQFIATMVVLTMVNILVSKQVKAKVLILAVTIVGLVGVYFMFQDVFNEMVEVTIEQGTDARESVRERSAKFYLFEFNPRPLAYLLGNGQAHFASPYGMRIYMIWTYYGYFMADIGIIGDYVTYGALYALCAILIFARLLYFRVSPELSHFKYFILYLVLIQLTTSGAFGSANLGIFMVAYLWDVDRQRRNNPLQNEI
ncbi:MAG: hypothetical protein GVY19_00380 [Bacteroidetes bacterium]|jgi:hypothetical protein|nr:hypothetical protein [Bacteroidota bacterium]